MPHLVVGAPDENIEATASQRCHRGSRGEYAAEGLPPGPPGRVPLVPELFVRSCGENVNATRRPCHRTGVGPQPTGRGTEGLPAPPSVDVPLVLQGVVGGPDEDIQPAGTPRGRRRSARGSTVERLPARVDQRPRSPRLTRGKQERREHSHCDDEWQQPSPGSAPTINFHQLHDGAGRSLPSETK